MVGDVAGRHCVLIDDMIDTAGTICAAAELLADAGAADIWAMATHARAVRPGRRPPQGLAPCPGWSSPTPCRSPTDAVFDKLEVLSVAKIIADAIDAVFEDTSVSEIFGGREPGLSSVRRPAPGRCGRSAGAAANLGSRPPRTVAARPARHVRSSRGDPPCPRSPCTPRSAGRWARARARRLRHDGKIPGVVYGHGTEPVAVAVAARDLRIALSGESGSNTLLSLVAGDQTFLTLAREMQRHPVRGTVTHVDFQIVRRDEIIAAEVPITLIGEALEVHHGDGLVDQQLFNLPVRARPADIPTVVEVDVTALTIGAALRVADLRAARRSHHRPRRRGGDRRPVSRRGSRPSRARPRARPRPARPPRPSPPSPPARTRPCAASSGAGGRARTAPAPWHPGRRAGGRAGQPGAGVRRHPPQRGAEVVRILAERHGDRSAS